jgi:protein SCO1
MRELKNPIWLFVIAIVCVPVVVFAFVSWYTGNFQSLPVFGDDQHKISDFQMTDQSGRVISGKDWKDKIIVADFFFTHCPSICPKMTKNLKTIQTRFPDDTGVLIQSFTVDPERDSVGRLAEYASQFSITGDRWNLLTGDKKEIYRLARKSFLLVATDGDGGPEDFIHSDKLVLIDAQKQIRGFYDGTSASETNQLIKDIYKLKKERRN